MIKTIARILNETDHATSRHLPAESIYGPPYLSFKFVLAYYSFHAFSLE